MASPTSRGRRGSLISVEDLVPLLLALAVGHVDSWSPEDEEDVLHCWEATGVSITTVLLGLAILCGGAAVVPLEHVALFEGVVDWRLVVQAGLL
jgi:hypothetical protein